MSKFKLWSALAVLAMLMLVFSSGCGGGGSNDDTTAETPADDTPRWDTDPVPTTPAPNGHSTEPAPTVPDTPTTPDVPTVPDTPTTPTVPDTPDTPTVPDTPTTPDTPEPTTPSPNTEQTPTTPDTYTDTYDIANVLNGNWYGVSGSGHANNADGTYAFTLILASMSVNVFGMQVSGSTCSGYLTHRQYWNCYAPSGIYITRIVLYGDAVYGQLIHTGNNTWSIETPEQVITVMLTSPNTAIVTDDSTMTINNTEYPYTLRYTIRKSAY